VAVISVLLVSQTCHLFVSSLMAVPDALDAPKLMLSLPDTDSEDSRYVTATGSVIFVERTMCHTISAAFSSLVLLNTVVWRPLIFNFL